METVWLVYAGRREGYALYYKFKREPEPKYPMVNYIKGGEVETVTFTTKLPLKGGIGSVYKVEREESEKEGSSRKIHFSKNQLPIGYWNMGTDLLGWRSKEKAYLNTKVILDKTKENILREQLAPLKAVYSELSFKERNAFLAEILNIITK